MPSERRLHPVSILFALFGSLKAFALPALLLMFSSLRGSSDRADAPQEPAGWFDRWTPVGPDVDGWQFWLLFFLVVSVVSAVLRYLTFRLTYEGTEFIIRSGLLFRNERHVPYDRIQTLDATRSPLHRFFGVAEVRVETGGGQEPEARISVLRESEFDDMRRRVFQGRTPAGSAAVVDEIAPAAPAAAAPTVVETPSPASSTLLHLPVRELLLLGLLDNRGFLLIAAAYGVLWETGLQGTLWGRLSASLSAPGTVSSIRESLATGQFSPFSLIGLMAAGLLGLVLVIRVLSMVWVTVTLHEFRLSAAGEDLRTEYGLLTRVTTTVPRRRIQSLTVIDSPLHRWCGRASVLVQTAGGPSVLQQGSRRERLAPIVRAADVPALVRHVLPQVDPASLEWQPLHPRAVRRAVKPLLVLIATPAIPVLAVMLAAWDLSPLPPVLGYLAIGTVAVVAITRRHIRHTAWAVDEQVIAFRSGWLWRSMTLAPIAKIQSVTTTESPFDRRARMASVSVDTAGGLMALPRVRIPFLGRDTALELAAQLSAKAAQTTFRW